MLKSRYGQRDLTADAASAGKRAYAELWNGQDNRFLQIIVTLTLTITADVTEILGLGSAVQVFDEIGLDDGGRDMGTIDPLFWVAVTEYLAGGKVTNTRASDKTAAGGPYSLSETIRIPFSYLQNLKESDTYFRESDTLKKLRVYYSLNATNSGVANLVRGGTAAVSDVTVEVSQYYDQMAPGDAPLLKPWWRRITVPVSQANTALRLDLSLDRSELLRGFTVLQWDSALGMVKDVINNFAFIGDHENYIGTEKLIDFDSWARSKEFESGGDVYNTPAGGLVHHNFQQRGYLSNCLNPAQDTNFRFLFDCQPSARAAHGNAEIRILLHLLKRDPTTRSDGKLITAPDDVFVKQFAA